MVKLNARFCQGDMTWEESVTLDISPCTISKFCDFIERALGELPSLSIGEKYRRNVAVEITMKRSPVEFGWATYYITN